MSRFGRFGEGRRLGSVLTGRRSRRRWNLPALLKAAVAVLLVGWMWSSITDLEARLRGANRARDTLAREQRQFRAAPVSGLAGNAAQRAGTAPVNAPSPAGRVSPGGPQGPPGNGTGEKKTEGTPGTAGAEGKPGSAGKDGEPGAVGPSGGPGDSGPTGKDGKDGTDGKDGREGKDGEPGPAGKDGTDGKDGDPGPAGRDGKDGKDGKDGDQGPEGPPGQVCPDGFSLQVPRWDSDALVCRRDDKKRAQHPSTRGAKAPAPAGRR